MTEDAIARGAAGRRRHHPPYPKEEVAKWQRERDKGRTTLDICREFGVAETTVQRRTKAP